MTQTLTKISLFLVVGALFVSCDAVKRLNDDELLLTKNSIIVDGNEETSSAVYSQLGQRPNRKALGVPIGLHFWNLAKPYPDSTYQDWLQKKPKREKRLVNFLSRKQVNEMGNSYSGFNRWIRKSGDPPVIISLSKINKSVERLEAYYFSKGWFNTKASFEVIKDSVKEKRGSVVYNITRYTPYIVDSISKRISSPVVDSLFKVSKAKSFIKSGKQYDVDDFINERDRLTIQFRNSGLYYFEKDYIGFDADTVDTGYKANIEYIIPDRRITNGDSVSTEPFKVHYITDVRIVTDYKYANRDKEFQDSLKFRDFTLYGYDKIKYRPKAITDAVSIVPNDLFQDIDRTLTYNQIRRLGTFKYPNISYQEDPRDSTGTGLIASILLSPKKKYTLGVDFDAFTSTIQQFGIGFSGTFLVRNVFRGAENLEISANGSVGSSKDAADSESKFFNVSDIGLTAKLTFPNILFPGNTDNIIPKYMSPFTGISAGISTQTNIGLDRQSTNSVFNYRWTPSSIKTYQLDLLNVQYVRNLNPDNYFNVYTTSYDRINEIAEDSNYQFEDPESGQLGIPEEINNFIADTFVEGNPYGLSNDELSELLSQAQRQVRLTEDNLIFATNFTWLRDSRQGLNDKSFSRVRWKLEAAGNLLSGIASIANLEKNAQGNSSIFGVVFSQYAKAEMEYIRHWRVSSLNTIAVRAFGGIAIPYGNSNSIPFTRSYFAGGANDNRGWRAYKLGPGSSGGPLDFNEANFKLAFNAEYRFTLLGSLKGALFVDAGNIWNVLDDIEDERFTFNGIEDLTELAIATGFGLRYDFGFFAFRFDIGFKTYDPARPKGSRWFKDYNFGNAVYNIGINYPF